MSKAPWHKRYHSDAIAGYMNLTLEERGAFSTLLDLMYDRMEPLECVSNERLLAGYLGVSVRKFRSVLAALVEKKKIKIINGGTRISNSRFEKEAENATKTSRKHAENGMNGARTKAEKQKNGNENNESDLAGLVAPDKPIPEARGQRPDKYGGGGGARTSATADFQIFVDAIGRPDFSVSAADQRESEFWTNKLALSQADQLAVVARVMAGKLDAPPNSFKFFTPAMEREAALKADHAERMADPLNLPEVGTRNDPRYRNPNSRAHQALDEAKRGLSDGSLDSIVAGPYSPGASRKR